MKRQLTSFVAATAIALAGAAAPIEAQAKDKDALKLILGAAAVALLLNQINKSKAQPVSRNPYPDSEFDDGQDEYPRRSGMIPAECVMDVTIKGRLKQVVSHRCIKEFGLASSIPSECAFDIRTSAGPRTVYGPQCLREYGYRIEQARY